MSKLQHKIWGKIGQLAFWVTWPGIWLAIQISPPRTRVAITHKGKVLLVQDWLGSGEWTLPGGGLKRHEPVQVGAARELLEETSIVVTPNSLKSIGSFRLKTNGIPVHITGFWKESKDLPDVAHRKGELLGCMWADSKQLKTLRISTTARIVLLSLDKQAGVKL